MTTADERLRATYDGHFYSSLDTRVRGSAEAVVPLVVDLLRPASLLDVGCGRGTWLKVFSEHGVADFVGVDGPHISAADLEIPARRFVAHDLTRPLDLGRRFDLVTSFEVAEHLPRDRAAAFVASLVAHSDVVLFSAAIPFQGGAEHVNEQWQTYWAEHFAARGYVPIDAFRHRIWSDERVAYWYAQNTILYVDGNHPALATLRALGVDDWPLDLVHPGLHERAHTGPGAIPPLSQAVRNLARSAARAARRRLPRRG